MCGRRLLTWIYFRKASAISTHSQMQNARALVSRAHKECLPCMYISISIYVEWSVTLVCNARYLTMHKSRMKCGQQTHNIQISIPIVSNVKWIYFNYEPYSHTLSPLSIPLLLRFARNLFRNSDAKWRWIHTRRHQSHLNTCSVVMNICIGKQRMSKL